MKAEVVKITPKKAKEFLKKNTHNRRISEDRVYHYAQMMVKGKWRENGEAIIFDKKDVLKNGQHRLKATIVADHTWNAIIVTDVDPDVMHTLDTGKGRSLQDYLLLEGYKNCKPIASMLRQIMSFDAGDVYGTKLTGNKRISIGAAASFYKEKEKGVNDLYKLASYLYVGAPFKVLSITRNAKYAYILKGFEINQTLIEFLEHINGLTTEKGTATYYLFRILAKTRELGNTLNEKWLVGMVISAWNSFIAGNPQIKTLKYNSNLDLPPIMSDSIKVEITDEK